MTRTFLNWLHKRLDYSCSDEERKEREKKKKKKKKKNDFTPVTYGIKKGIMNLQPTFNDNKFCVFMMTDFQGSPLFQFLNLISSFFPFS